MKTDIKIEINKNGEKGLFAKKNFKKDDILFPLEGRPQKYPTKYTIQITPDEHIDDSLGHFLNHSCDPNTYVSAASRSIRALRDIMVGEELSFDYNSSEYEMATPFQCRCGSAKCRGKIKGYKFNN